MREPDVLATDTGTAVLDEGSTRGGTIFIADGVELRVPAWVLDLDSFRRWADTDEFPEWGNIWWLRGKVWADMSKEQIFSHLAVKLEIARVLGNLVKSGLPGLVIPDGLFWSNEDADVAGKPDVTFISTSALDRARVRLIEGAKGGYVEVQGSPDMVLEVVSASSIKKDLIIQFENYWRAGIPEYWLVDARVNPPQFDIFRHGPKSYKRSAKKHGWMVSPVFGKSFRLSVVEDKAGRPDYTLELR